VTADRQAGAKAKVRTRRLCQLRQVQHGVAVIDVSYEILTPVDAYVQSQLIDRLTEGTVRFDIDRGRIVSQRHDVDRRVLGFAGKTSNPARPPSNTSGIWPTCVATTGKPAIPYSNSASGIPSEAEDITPMSHPSRIARTSFLLPNKTTRSPSPD